MSTTKIIIFSLVLFLSIVNAIFNSDICNNKSDGAYTNYINSDCGSYHLCTNQTLIKTLNCMNPFEPIFSSYRQRCVRKNSFYDECYLTNITENLDNCAWFSIQVSTMPNITYHHSCSYPQLFDLESQECQHYSRVQCNKRFEPKDACEYRDPQIHTSIDERPCWLTPSCRGKANGFFGDQRQECSSYYECKDERFISSLICPRRLRFSDKYKACVPTLVNCENITVY